MTRGWFGQQFLFSVVSSHYLRAYNEIPLMHAIRLLKKALMFVYN
jgi:hypothetical protein